MRCATPQPKQFLLPCLLGLAVLAPPAQAEQSKAEIIRLRTDIARARSDTWRWQQIAFVSPTRSAYSERREHSIAYLRWDRRLWSNRRIKAMTYAQHPPYRRAWLCIHRFEGGWTDDTGNGYFGGLQMDRDFMSTYGPELYRAKGTADHWTPLEQIWVAEKARASGRGFYPWPNTARKCGLI